MTNFFLHLYQRATRPGQTFGRLAALLLLALLPLLGRAGTPVLTFQATVPTSAGVDVMAFVDKVEIINAYTGVLVASGVPNGSFETFVSLANGTYGYNPSGASWTFNARSGITANGSTFAPPPTTAGSYAALLQTNGGGVGAFSQKLPALPAGTYQVRAQLAQRSTSPANQGVAILVDGREVGRSVPANDNAYHTFLSAPFVVDAVLRLEATGPVAAGVNPDVTAFVDAVEILDGSTGAPIVGAPVANASFETFTAPLNFGNYGYNPAGATWNFLGSSGIAASGSGFDNPNPSPDGGYVAFLQTTRGSYSTGPFIPSTISQTLPGALSGSVRVRLKLAQRTNTTSADQGVRVYLNDVVLATFAPGGSSFQLYTTNTFSAQPLVVVSRSPTSNQTNAALATNVAVTFSQPLQNTAATLGAVRVFSQQRGGLLRNGAKATATVSGNTLTLDPATNFKPGETVSVTTTTAAAPTTGPALTSGKVHQFMTATSGTGRGRFAGGSDPTVPGVPSGTALGDVDGDGDLDLLVTSTSTNNYNSAVSVRLNGGDATGSNTGAFSNGSEVDLTPVCSDPGELVLGDVDNDGDLDLVVPSPSLRKAFVRLNGGDATGSNTGVFSNGSTIDFSNALLGGYYAYNAPYLAKIKLGDLDGDGDLDLLAMESHYSKGAVFLNGGSGTGVFSYGNSPEMEFYNTDSALGDVDGDGDLDFVVATSIGKGVLVRLNGGDASGSNTGTFGAGVGVAVSFLSSVALGDVDGDGDLDLVCGTRSSNTANTIVVLLNGGDASGSNTGVFSNGTTVNINNGDTQSLALGDLDADGDLDVMAVGRSGSTVLINNGNMSFNGLAVANIAAANSTALGDVDGDGDLDLAANQLATTTVAVRLNQAPLPAITSISPATGPVGTVVTVTGTNLAEVQGVRVNGFAGTVVGTPTVTSLTFVVGPGSSTGPIGFTVPGGTVTDPTVFTVVATTLTALSPARNLRSAAPATNVALTFSQPLQNTAATLGAVRVFSQQRGGLLRDGARATASVSGNTLTLDPNTNFKPGETVFVTTTTAATTTSGATLSSGKVHQFTVATGGTGRGVFDGGTDPTVGSAPRRVATGDVDGDGDLDVVTANYNATGTVSVRLNGGNASGSNTGVFAGGSTVSVDSNPHGVVLGDVDGDGDLDLITANDGGTLSVRLNGGNAAGGGTGTFSNGSTVTVGGLVRNVVLGDVDGDGDLDLVTANDDQVRSPVFVRLNGGDGSGSNTGVFSGGSEVYLGYPPASPGSYYPQVVVDMVVLADVDNDGDLDIAAAFRQVGQGSDNVVVRLNGGDATGFNQGVFSNGRTGIIASGAVTDLAVGDMDGDGDLDLVAVTTNGVASVVENNSAGYSPSGPGVFYASVDVPVGSNAQGVALGDVNGDGRLDIVTANAGSSTASVRLSTGQPFAGSATPAFAPAPGVPEATVGNSPYGVALADVDGDGDLDFVTANAGGGTVSVRLNQPFKLPIIAGFTPASGPTGTSVTVTGTYLAEVTAVTVSGVAGTLTGAPTATSLTFVVAAGSTTGPIALTSPGGTAVSSTDFTVIPPTITSFTPSSGPAGTSVTLTGTLLDGATAVSVNGTAGTITANTATSLTFTVAAGTTTGPIRVVVPVGTAVSSTNFTVLPPTITSFTPASGPVGTSVTLTGMYLDGATSVSVNGAAGTITANTPTSLTFIVGPGSTTGRIRLVAASGAATSSTDFVLDYLAITSLSPTRNQGNVAASANVAVTFSQPLQNTAATLGAVRVFSQQRGGLLRDGARATATVSGNTITLDPNTNFKPGETVLVSATATATSSGGNTPNVGRVHQFTTATGGTGQGLFGGGTDPTTGTGNTGPTAVAAADVDGDGDLDLLAANYNTNTVSVRLNGGTNTGSNTGAFSNGSDIPVANNPRNMAVGDVDGDGDLDFVTACVSNTLSVRLNGGDATGSNTGKFSNGSDLPVANSPRSIALGDVDGDGDLDLVTATLNSVGVRLNGGDATGSNTGVFSNGADLSILGPLVVALGDVDGDGDLDLVTANGTSTSAYSGPVSVRLNGGDATGSNTGVFSNGSDITVGSNPRNVILGDLDGDGDLDLLTANNGGSAVSVRLNGGDATGSNTGKFSNGSDPAVGTQPSSLALGDVDGDGDLDLVTTSAQTSGTVSVLLNGGNGLGGGTGTFSNPNSSASSVAVGNTPRAVALADLDGDGDLDMLAANFGGNTVSVRLNQAPAYSLSRVSPAAELPGQVVTLLGTGFTSGSTVQFGTTAANVTAVSATSLTVTVPASLPAGSAPISVSTGGVATPGLPFTVLAVYDGGTLNDCAAAVPATASVGDGAWHYLLSAAGQVVAAYNYSGASLGTLALDALRADPAQPVRQDANKRYYLGRNWHLTASAGRFDGRTVGLRLYGLNAEQARLLGADNTATLTNLKATQYSGPNEDCLLGNNSRAGESRVLPAPATSPSGTSYFIAELSVADHFSEFYLTGSPTPLPVELTAFSATAAGPAAVRLAWATASEKNSAAFDVERSADGRAFARVGTLAAAGSSATPRSYELLDGKLPAGTPLLYYRLRQVDQDGTFAYSPVRTVALVGAAAGLALFPNPVHGSATTLTGAQPGAVVTVLDALGRQVLTAPADAAGTAVLALPTGLATGVYVVRTGSQALRLTVE
jgi:hypothetical protein